MSWYRQRLERDLQRWLAAGWLNDAGAAAIRTDLDARKSPFGAASIFAVLSAVLFGLAVMSFVAAHWTGMSKLSRLLLLLGALWACYGGAAVLFQRRLHAFAQAAVLGGIAVYGASIMLIAQMYHMDGNPPDAVLTWALGALLAAVLVASGPALAATFVLLGVWTCWERALSGAAHWWFLIPWGAAAMTAAWLRWRPGLHLAAVCMMLWLVPLGFLVLGHHAHWLVVVAGLAIAVPGAALAPAIDRHAAISAALFAYGIAIGYAGFFILQFIDDGRWLLGPADSASLTHLLLMSALTLALLLGAMLWGIASDNRAALWLAYAAFAIEVFMLYVRTFGTLLNTSLFFLVAALIVSGLAWLAYRLHQRKTLQGIAA